MKALVFGCGRLFGFKCGKQSEQQRADNLSRSMLDDQHSTSKFIPNHHSMVTRISSPGLRKNSKPQDEASLIRPHKNDTIVSIKSTNHSADTRVWVLAPLMPLPCTVHLIIILNATLPSLFHSYWCALLAFPQKGIARPLISTRNRAVILPKSLTEQACFTFPYFIHNKN